MKRMAAKIVPKLLSFEQKQHGMDIALEMFTTFKDDPVLLKKVITGDESWVYGYGIETKAQSSQCKQPEEPSSEMPCQVLPNVMVLLIIFFD